MLLFIVALACLPAADAAAKPPATALAFAEAGAKLRAAAFAQRPAIAKAYEETEPERCLRVIREGTPRRARRVAQLLLLTSLFQPVAEALYEPEAQMVRDLAAIRTRDPALRSFRAVIRAGHERAAADEHVYAPCFGLEEWKDGGWLSGEAPSLFTAEFIGLEEAVRLEKKLAGGVRRLRQLGVPAAELLELRNADLIKKLVPARYRAYFVTPQEALAAGSDG
jgi:hypothetical protein